LIYSLSDIACRGTIEDTELIDGVLLDQRASHVPGAVDRVEKAKIGLIQFCLSAPKTDVIPSYSHDIA
jgi:T-complex protein 1 subunit delta